MKKLILSLVFIFIITLSCSKPNEEAINSNPHNLQQLGLTANNIYPFFPDTWSAGLGDNMWFNHKIGDTLIVFRRDEVYDDSGQWLYYKFLVKPNQWIVPLTIKRTVNDHYHIPIYNNYVAFDKPIVNFELQAYQENVLLACKITTPNGIFNSPGGTLIDKMWININP